MVVFGAVLLGMLVAALNQTVVGTAMPRIAAELNGLDSYPWVFTSFMITSAAALPIFGKLSDMYGRKLFFMLGILVLMGGSVLAGTSQNIFQLAVYRGIQGVGAGALMSNAMSIIGELFTPLERGKYQALNQGVFTAASILGPLVGGLITDHLSWRWVFYVNVPVGLLALAVTGAIMPPFRNDRGRHAVDYWGAVVLVLAVSPLLLGFSWAGQRYPWGSPQVVGLFALSAAMLALFGIIESRVSEPILPLNLFRNSIFAITCLVSLLVGIGMFGAMVYLPLFIQAVGGQTATSSGLVLMPLMVAAFVAGVIGGQIVSRSGRYRALVLFSTAVGALGMFLLARMGVGTTNVTITRNMVVVGAGFGIAMPLLIVVVQNAFPQRLLGVVVSSGAFFRSLGGTIGVAVMGTVVGSRFMSGFAAGLPPETLAQMRQAGASLPTTPQALLSSGTVSALGAALPEATRAEMLQQVLVAMRSSLATAMGSAFLLGAVAVGVAFLACLFLREIPLRKSNVTHR